jgi:hypothetical protein
MGELLPADAFDHMDVGGRAMSGTIAEIELVVGDGLYDFGKGRMQFSYKNHRQSAIALPGYLSDTDLPNWDILLVPENQDD